MDTIFIFAAVTDAPEVRGHDDGHCEASTTGQPLAAVTAAVEAAVACVEEWDEQLPTVQPGGQLPPFDAAKA